MSHSAPFLHASKRKRWFIVVFAVALLVWIVCVAAVSVHVTGKLFTAQQDIEQAQLAFSAFSFDEAKQETQEAQVHLNSARRALSFVRTATWLPMVGNLIETVADLILSTEALLRAFDPVIDLGQDLTRLSGITQEYVRAVEAGVSPEVTFEDLSTHTKQAVLSRLAASADDLELLVTELAILEEEMALLAGAIEIGPLLSILDPLVKDVQDAQQPLQLLSIVARLLPTFGGLEDPSTILLLFLNNNELRPGGGFIGSYGVMEMSGGDISHLETADVYALDRAVEDSVTRLPPEPLSRYNATDTWFFRDSNWSPDFSLSSAQAIELFLNEVGFLEPGINIPTTTHVDGLVGFTPTFAADLLAITGSITVGGQTFTADTVADLLEYQVQYGYATTGIPEVQRKEILADLIHEMKSRLYSLPSQQWPAVLEAAQIALREKQMLFYSADPEVQTILMKTGWAGSMHTSTPDTLMVVDANLASLKSDPNVARDVTYEIYQNASAQWIGRVAIHYQHQGTFDWKTTRYRTYTRIYLPTDTEFLSVEGSWLNDKTQNPSRAKGKVDVVDELGLTSFGTFTSVEPGEENTLIFEFVLAPQVVEAIEAQLYELTVIKQAGAQNNALTLDLDFGKTVARAHPPEDSTNWGDEVYHLNTIVDQDLEITVELSHL
jgi:hypothetical protein